MTQHEKNITGLLNTFLKKLDSVEQYIEDNEKVTWIDKTKAMAFPTLITLNGIFFFSMYNKIEKIDSIETKVNVLMKVNKIAHEERQQKNQESYLYLEAIVPNEITLK